MTPLRFWIPLVATIVLATTTAHGQIPVLLTPVPGAIMDNGCNVGPSSIVWDFDWTDVPGASAYHLYVIGATATIPVVNNSNITSSSYQYTSSGYITQTNQIGWQWRVRALVGGVWNAWSPTRLFDVEPLCSGTSPAPPLISPAAGAVLDNGCDVSPDTIDWSFDWGDTPGATAYHLHVMGPNATIPLIDESMLALSSYQYTSSGYVVGTNQIGWEWRVRVLVSGAWSAWSPTRVFDVEPLCSTGSGPAPTLLLPAAGAIMDNGCDVGPDNIVWDFQWDDVPGATAYHLHVIGATAMIPVVDNANLTQTSHQYTNSGYIPQQNQLGWQWRVRALVSGLWTTWSPTRLFDVEALCLDGGTDFVRGDCNDDGGMSLPDAVVLLAYLFPQGPPSTLACDDACDANDDGSLNLVDAIGILNALFGQPPVPVAAPLTCGADPTGGDPLDCAQFSSCP